MPTSRSRDEIRPAGVINPGDLHMLNTRLNQLIKLPAETGEGKSSIQVSRLRTQNNQKSCLLYTSDAADDC